MKKRIVFIGFLPGEESRVEHIQSVIERENLNAEFSYLWSRDTTQINKAVKNADAVVVGMAHVTGSDMDQMPNCKVIIRYGVGVDTLDIGEATKRNIWIANIPDANFEEVSDHAVALMLDCVRNVSRLNNLTHHRKPFNELDFKMHRLKGQTLGIVGFGRIGSAFHRKIKGFDFGNIYVHDPHVSLKKIESSGCISCSKETIFRESDLISVHPTLTDSTFHLIDESCFSVMKDNSIFINTSRGKVVDEQALITAIKKKKICAAGLDVTEMEPLEAGNPLLKMDNVILTGHSASHSIEAVFETEEKIGLSVVQSFTYGRPLYPVNMIQQ
jgi:D-3-phosphoglycerate dehydrogenase